MKSWRIRRGRNSNGITHSWLEEIVPEVVASNVGPVTHPRRTIIDEIGNTFHIEHHGKLTIVDVTLPNGIHARGNALCDDSDTYNREFGEHLATIRASQRALRKQERWVIREAFRL